VALRYSYEISQTNDDNEVFNKLKDKYLTDFYLISNPINVIVETFIDKKRKREFQHSTEQLMFPHDYNKASLDDLEDRIERLNKVFISDAHIYIFIA
jgi:hypothetical protein